MEANYALTTAAPTPLISVVCEGELRTLALQSAWGAEKQQRFENLLNLFIVVPVPYAGITEAYARIADYSRRRGIAMGQNDLWIAATAHVTGARLLTTDGDFDHLEGVFLGRDWVDPVTV